MLDRKVVEYFENLIKNKAIYLWGANGEIITKILTDKLYKTFKSAHILKNIMTTSLKRVSAE